MKLILFILISLCFTLTAFGQNTGTTKNKIINWQDVVVIENDSLRFDTTGAKGEGNIERRKKVNSIKDLNYKELNHLKKDAASKGALIVFISFSNTDKRFIHYLYCYGPLKNANEIKH
jgi:hypothetical protein